MKLFSMWIVGILLVACGKETAPAPAAPVNNPKPGVSQKVKDDKLNEYVKEFKDLKYQVVCIGQRNSDRPILFALKTDRARVQEAKKITDYDAILFDFYEKDGKFDVMVGLPFNIVKQDRTELNSKGGTACTYTTWSFLLHVDGSNPLNNARVFFDRAEESKQDFELKGLFTRSPLRKADQNIELDCPVFELK